MGRRGSMRGRSGVFFIGVLGVALVILYLSWRSILTPSMKMNPMELEPRDDAQLNVNNFRIPESDLDKNEEERRREPDYDFDTAFFRRRHNKESVEEQVTQHENEVTKRVPVAVEAPLPDHTHPPETVKQVTETKPYYRQPNHMIQDTVAIMERFVHLDLKGAPPNMAYLRKFLPLVAKLGATGLLIEYEDMFPYTGMLGGIAAGNAYSMEDIRELLGLAKKHLLKVMPLIQTFGHMEFVLKSSFSYLRESKYTPQVLDVTNNASYAVISEMVSQILAAHPEATHVHIGCDEVYELGRGNSANVLKSEGIDKAQLFLRHVRKVVDIVRSKNHGRNVVPVMWDDQLRHLSVQDIQKSKLPELVEIMVWQYTTNVLERVNATVWDKYSMIFQSVWIASSFKGATGARQFFTEPQYHIQNHFSWLDVIAAYKGRLTFKGIILTGWQRYDHFATLCELLPVAVPSLAACLATVQNAGFNEAIHWQISEKLDCHRNIELTFPFINKKDKTAFVTQDCRFPGSELWHGMQEFYGHTLAGDDERVSGWLSDYQVDHGFSNPGQMLVLSKKLRRQSSRIAMIAGPLQRVLSNIYPKDTVEEWMAENINERQERIKEKLEKVTTLMNQITWPRRPLPSLESSGESEKSGGTNNRDVNLDDKGQSSVIKDQVTQRPPQNNANNDRVRAVRREEIGPNHNQDQANPQPNSNKEALGSNMNGAVPQRPQQNNYSDYRPGTGQLDQFRLNRNQPYPLQSDLKAKMRLEGRSKEEPNTYQQTGDGNVQGVKQQTINRAPAAQQNTNPIPASRSEVAQQGINQPAGKQQMGFNNEAKDMNAENSNNKVSAKEQMNVDIYNKPESHRLDAYQPLGRPEYKVHERESGKTVDKIPDMIPKNEGVQGRDRINILKSQIKPLQDGGQIQQPNEIDNPMRGEFRESHANADNEHRDEKMEEYEKQLLRGDSV